MVNIIQQNNTKNKLLISILNSIKTTLNDKYVLLQCDIDFSNFINSASVELLVKKNTHTLYISEKLKERDEDFSEVKNHLKLTNNFEFTENLGYLLLIEIESYKNIIEIGKKHINKNNDVKKVENDITFIAAKPKFSLEQIILNENEKEDITSALTLIQERELIYDKWGFSEIDSKPRLILNFYGAPGTGKTMSAHAIATELNKNILLINYSEIESKYVGDAPKNLMKAFEEAKKSDALLFFDEADSFLGKRVENVSSSSDQSVNSLRSQMLILLEDFEGVVIFATNLVKNYDSAFESRILKHLEFKLPSIENRIKIIDRMLVNKIPFTKDFNRDTTIQKLAELTENFSGREIKNAILESLSLAAHNKLERLDETILISGFEKSKSRKEAIEKNKNIGKISPELKKDLEAKIKNNLEKQEKVDQN